MNKADQSRRAGLYENALKYYSRALELDRSLVAGWVGQVQMLVQLEEYPEAELWSRKGLELFPNNGELMAGRAQAFCRMGDMKQAHALCDGSLRQAGQSAYRWLVRGEIMVAGRHRTWTAIVSTRPRNWTPTGSSPWRRPAIELYYHRPGKALGRIRRALELAPDAAYAWYVQGVCQAEFGLTRGGEREFSALPGAFSPSCRRGGTTRRLQGWSWSPIKMLRRLLGR